MAPKRKGMGDKKGKGPAKKAPPRRVQVVHSDDSEDDIPWDEAFKRIQALESLRAGYVPPAPSAHRASKGSDKRLMYNQLCSRISTLEQLNSEEDGPSHSMSHNISLPESSESHHINPDEQVPVGNSGAVCPVMRHRMLICGHSMVFWAAHQARRSHFLSQLGLSDKAIIEWRGKRGLRWQGLLQLLFGESQCMPPHVLVIHLGGNDLGFVKGKALVLQAIHDMRLIRERWPFVKLIWSAMLPRQVWRCGGEPRILNRARRRVNNQIRKAMIGGLGFYLAHDDIVLLRPELYRADGIHLSEVGNQIFLRDLQAGVAACLASLVGDRG